MNLSVYSDIFDVVEKNMQSAGGRFNVSRTAYLCTACNDAQKVDIYDLSHEEDNRLFLETAYIALLKRLVDERALTNWEGRLDIPKEEFQRLLTNSIMNSLEFSKVHIKVYNNIYSQRNAFGGKISSAVSSGGMSMPERLMKFYRKQPEFMKKLEKKIMGVK